MQFSGLADAILLVALGIGYVVLYLAKREEKGLQLTGYLIGGLIIILAAFYIVGNILFRAEYQRNMLRTQSLMMHRGTMQPRMPKTIPAPATAR
jgi:hypothetical protein